MNFQRSDQPTQTTTTQGIQWQQHWQTFNSYARHTNAKIANGFIAGLFIGLVVFGWWLWPVEWTDAMARLKNGDGGGPSGHYAYETTRRESGALPTTSYPARGAESDPAVNPTVFSTGDPKFGQNNKYIDRSTRCVSFFFLKTAKLKDSEA